MATVVQRNTAWTGSARSSTTSVGWNAPIAAPIVKRDANGEVSEPISRDDVLDAHEFLTRWDGTVQEIITPRAA